MSERQCVDCKHSAFNVLDVILPTSFTESGWYCHHPVVGWAKPWIIKDETVGVVRHYLGGYWRTCESARGCFYCHPDGHFFEPKEPFRWPWQCKPNAKEGT